MKYIIHFLVILTLAATQFACSRVDNTNPPANTIDEGTTVTPSNQEPSQAVQPAPQEVPKTATAPAPRPAAPRPAAPAPAAPAPRPADADRPAEPIAAAPAPVTHPAAPAAPSAPAAPAVSMLTVPSGTALTVIMSDGVSTATSKDGDTFTGSLAESISIDGKVVAERGDKVSGRVQNVVKPGKVKGRAQLELVLTEITPVNRSYKLSTEPFVGIAVDNRDRDAAIIAGGAGVGAAIGAITGGKKGAALGAILGGGGGTTAVLVTPGEDMKIEPEAKVNFVLKDSVRLPVLRTNAS